MGSSKAKKSAKKADFQKPKLKVGKARPKASNVTDTSFKAKGIVLKDQQLSTETPSLGDQVPTLLAHLSSRSDSQRKESLAALTNRASKSAVSTQIVLERALPLITDGSSGVREQLLRLLYALPAEQCRGYEGRVVLYLQTGLTHIAGGVCRSALDLLAWASAVYGSALVSCHGGWYKILKCFLLLLNWKQGGGDKEWAGNGAAIEKLNKEPKLMVKVLDMLSAFIRLGLTDAQDSQHAGSNAFMTFVPHLIPMHSRPFVRLGLFEAPKDVENQLYDDVTERRAVFTSHFRATLERGIQVVKRQGGELGRSGGTLTKAITESCPINDSAEAGQ